MAIFKQFPGDALREAISMIFLDTNVETTNVLALDFHARLEEIELNTLYCSVWLFTFCFMTRFSGYRVVFEHVCLEREQFKLGSKRLIHSNNAYHVHNLYNFFHKTGK